ncbi:hypothetical protein M3606_23150 [Cytobacillus horneckiae]|nr:hypothetical protein [Cytobacillus horneckiae]
MYPYYYFPCQPPYYYPSAPYPYYAQNYRTFPSVDPSKFIVSAKEMEGLMTNASKLLAKMAESRQFSYNIMTAAQESNQAKVESLIQSTGINNIPKVTYNPDGLRLIFEAKGDTNTSLALRLRWT